MADNGVWTEDTVLELLHRFDLDASKLWQSRAQYRGLLYQQTKKRTRICPQYYNLVFDRRDSRDFSDNELDFLIGPKWPKQKVKCTQNATKADQILTLDMDGCDIDLANIESDKWLSAKFNILSQGRNVMVVGEKEDHRIEIPPVVNLAISLTLVLCSSHRGMFVWQPKSRKGSDNASWNRVPDIMYVDYIWLPQEADAFRKLGYRRQRDYLSAPSLLESTDVVLPFVLDFEGVALEDAEDARVTADIDGKGIPKAAISIPGSAFIGWFSRMSPDPSNWSEMRQYYRSASKKMGAQVLLSPGQRDKTRATSLLEMGRKAQDMFATPEEDGLNIYGEVLKMVERAVCGTDDDDQEKSALDLDCGDSDESDMEVGDNSDAFGDE